MNMCLMKIGMVSCDQTKGVSIMDHGKSVAKYYKDIKSHLEHGTNLEFEWRMPSWINDPLILENLLPDDTMETYHIYHDCGKPQCIEWDTDGKRHFPNHVRASEATWNESTNNTEPLIGKLIGMDMDIHLLKADGVAEFAARPEALSLLMTGLAEVHSNASMFGGIESTSFKIKFKHIEKRGKQILKLIAANGNTP